MSKPTAKGRKRQPPDPLRPVPLDAGVAALRRVRAIPKPHRAVARKAAFAGRWVPTETDWRPTADRAEAADKITRRSATSARSAVSSSTYKSGSAPLARILTDRCPNRQGWVPYKELASTLPTHVPPISHGWAVVSVDQRSSHTRPICRGILMLEENVATGALFVKIKNLKGGNSGDVRPTPVPPSTLAAQKWIVAEVVRRLSEVEELESMEPANLQRGTRFRQAILEKAFTGNSQSENFYGI